MKCHWNRSRYEYIKVVNVQVYVDRALQDKKRYEDELAEYNKSLVDESPPKVLKIQEEEKEESDLEDETLEDIATQMTEQETSESSQDDSTF